MASFVMVRPVSVSDMKSAMESCDNVYALVTSTVSPTSTNEKVNDFASSANIQNQNLAPSASMENKDLEPPLKPIAKMLRQTRQCKHYLKGACRYGDKCGFSHSEVVNERPNFNKTRMCMKFQKGFCMNGENCRFAHSRTELKQLDVTSKRTSKPLETQFARGAAELQMIANYMNAANSAPTALPPETQRKHSLQTSKQPVTTLDTSGNLVPMQLVQLQLANLNSVPVKDENPQDIHNSNMWVPSNARCISGQSIYQLKYHETQSPACNQQSINHQPNYFTDDSQTAAQGFCKARSHARVDNPEQKEGQRSRKEKHLTNLKNKAIADVCFPAFDASRRSMEEQSQADSWCPNHGEQNQAELPDHDEECTTPRLSPNHQEHGSYVRSRTPEPELVDSGYGMHPAFAAQSKRLDMLS